MLFILTFVAVLGCALVGGVFFGFSVFIMKGLGRIPPAQGMAAMQSINVTAVGPGLMIAMFGTGAVCLVLAIAALLARQRPEAPYLLIGAALYIAGNIVVTILFNVPRNDALAAADPASAEGARLWADYLVTWTAWNHVRTVTGLAAAAAFIVALLKFE